MLSDPVLRFYPIIDTGVCARRGLDPRAVARACLRGGVRLLQLRVKEGSSAHFLALATELAAAARDCDAHLIVNDRADIARLAGAAGVHLGQEDLPPAAVRRLLGDGLIGLSTHDAGQVDQGLAMAVDYIAVGPVYETGTKVTGYTPRGLELVRYAAGRGTPVVAIGGITLDRAPEVLAAGAAAIAVITDLVSTADVEARARSFMNVVAPGARPPA